jgi:hypothetical protein
VERALLPAAFDLLLLKPYRIEKRLYFPSTENASSTFPAMALVYPVFT